MTSDFQERSPFDEILKLDAKNNLTLEERVLLGEEVHHHVIAKINKTKVGRPIESKSKKQTVLRLLNEGYSIAQIQEITGYDKQIIWTYKSTFWKKGA